MAFTKHTTFRGDRFNEAPSIIVMWETHEDGGSYAHFYRRVPFNQTKAGKIPKKAVRLKGLFWQAPGTPDHGLGLWGIEIEIVSYGATYYGRDAKGIHYLARDGRVWINKDRYYMNKTAQQAAKRSSTSPSGTLHSSSEGEDSSTNESDDRVLSEEEVADAIWEEVHKQIDGLLEGGQLGVARTKDGASPYIYIICPGGNHVPVHVPLPCDENLMVDESRIDDVADDVTRAKLVYDLGVVTAKLLNEAHTAINEIIGADAETGISPAQVSDLLSNKGEYEEEARDVAANFLSKLQLVSAILMAHRDDVKQGAVVGATMLAQEVKAKVSNAN